MTFLPFKSIRYFRRNYVAGKSVHATIPSPGKPRHGRNRQRTKFGTKLLLEVLEDRTLLTTYTVTDLGTLSGYSSSYPTAINDSGQIVGNTWSGGLVNTGLFLQKPGPLTEAWLYSGGTLSALGTLSGDLDSGATGINNSGQIVGYSFGVSMILGEYAAFPWHAFVYSNGTMTDVLSGNDFSSDDSSANAINDSGEIVGSSLDSPFIESGGAVTDIGGTGGSGGDAINAAGQVTGSGYFSTENYTTPFLYSAGTVTDLGLFKGGPTFPTGINDSGQIVGYSTSTLGNLPGEGADAFLYSGGVYHDLGGLNLIGGGDDFSRAYGINNLGQVVGMSDGDAFVYSNGVMTDLNNVIPSNSGWTLTEATAINGNGEIVGEGYNPSGFHPFLLTSEGDQWTGLGNDDLWSDGNNWLGGIAPTAGANVLFPAGAKQLTSDNDLGVTFGSVTIDDSYTFSGQPLTVSGTLDVHQGTTEFDCSATAGQTTSVDAGASLAIGAGATLDVPGQDALNVAGNASLSLLVGSNLDLSGSATIASGGTVNMADSSTLALGGSLELSGTASVANGAALNVDAGATLTQLTGSELDISGNATVASGGSLVVDGNALLNLLPQSLLSDSGNVSEDAGDYVTIAGGGMVAVNPGGTASFNGHGSFDANSNLVESNNANVSVAASGDVNFDGNASLAKGSAFKLATAGQVSLMTDSSWSSAGDTTTDPGSFFNIQSQNTVALLPGGNWNMAGKTTFAAGSNFSAGSNSQISVLANGDCEYAGTGTIAAQCTVNVDANGTFNQSGGKLDVFGNYMVQSGGQYNLKLGGDYQGEDGSSLGIQGVFADGGVWSMTGQAATNLSNGGHFVVTGTADNGGKYSAAVGTTTSVQGVGLFEILAGGKYDNGGSLLISLKAIFSDRDDIAVESGATVDVAGTLNEAAGGHLDNSGTVTVEPGAFLNDNSTVVAEAGSTIADYGALSVGGTGLLDIAGTVTIEQGGSFNPQGTVTIEAGGLLNSAAASGASEFLILTTPAQTLAAAQTSGLITIQLESQTGTPAQAGVGGLTLTLSSTSGAGSFLDTQGNPLSSPSITIAQGSSTASFEYDDTRAGMPTLTVAGPGFSITQQETVVPAAASSFIVTGFPSPTVAGTSGSFTVTAVDPYGNIAPSYLGTVQFASSDSNPAAVLPAPYAFTASDGGVHTFSATLVTAGIQSLTATDSVTASITGVESRIGVKPGAVAHFTVDLFPGSERAGVTATFQVIVQDAYGNTVPTYTGTVHFTSSDPNTAVRLPPDYTFENGDYGNRVLFHATLDTAGTQTITATDTVNSAITGKQIGIVIAPAAVTHFRVYAFPNPTIAGVGHTVTVAAKDIYGNTVTSYTGMVSLGSSDPLAVLPGSYTFSAADAGIHTFGVVLRTAGSQSITVTGAVIGTITGSEVIIVQPATAQQLLIYGPTSVTAGVPQTYAVEVLDAYGNIASVHTGTVHFTSSDSNANLPADYTFTAADAGQHSFTGGVTFNSTSSNKILSAIDTLFASINGSLTGIDVA
jgi:probable HAF family extracellular repeat protein